MKLLPIHLAVLSGTTKFTVYEIFEAFMNQ